MEDEEVHFVASNEDKLSTTGDALVAAPRALPETGHGQEGFREVHTDTQVHMRERVLDQFPPALWIELKQKRATTTAKEL